MVNFPLVTKCGRRTTGEVLAGQPSRDLSRFLPADGSRQPFAYSSISLFCRILKRAGIRHHMNIFMTPTVVSIHASNRLTGENVSRFAACGAGSRLARYCVAAAFSLLAISSPYAQEKAADPSATKPAAAKSKPAAKRSGEPAAKSSSKAKPETSAEADSAGLKAVEEIFACVAQGLPEGWQRAWVVVTELSGDLKERRFEGRFQVSLEASGDKRWDYVPCNSRQVAESVYRLNDFLDPEKRRWKTATLLFLREGRFELKYDYSR